jgi:outer membrane protein TolC
MPGCPAMIKLQNPNLSTSLRQYALGYSRRLFLGVRGMTSVPSLVTALAVIIGLSGCASYHPAPLAPRANLASGLSRLDLDIPVIGAGYPSRTIDITKPLSADDIGLLAILNDPNLKSEQGELGVARAEVLQAELLPNPSASLGYGALLGGPGTASSFTASLSQDIAAIVTRGARTKSASARLEQVNADQLWREWQVAQKARQLAVDISSDNRVIGLTEREHQLLLQEADAVKTAIARGNLATTALAPLLTAVAAAEQSLRTLRLAQLANWQDLDGQLGLVPSVRFALEPPVFAPPPDDIEGLVADLPERRPDLAGLRFGYDSAEADVRAAILGQFPAFTLGGTYTSDTTKVVSAGPDFTFALPVFDRNQGNIARTNATRTLLREQYQARLDSAVANVYALIARLGRLSGDLVQAQKADAAAASLAATARRAYAAGNLDARTLTDYETTSLQRAVEVVSIERRIGEDRIFLDVELGLGLPRMRIALRTTASS